MWRLDQLRFCCLGGAVDGRHVLRDAGHEDGLWPEAITKAQRLLWQKVLRHFNVQHLLVGPRERHRGDIAEERPRSLLVQATRLLPCRLEVLPARQLLLALDAACA